MVIEVGIWCLLSFWKEYKINKEDETITKEEPDDYPWYFSLPSVSTFKVSEQQSSAFRQIYWNFSFFQHAYGTVNFLCYFYLYLFIFRYFSI